MLCINYRKGLSMSPSARNLLKRRDKLSATALEASRLATTERTLADNQHLAASMLEHLADDLASQVVEVEVEIRAAAAAA
jgi:hypothetical protein